MRITYSRESPDYEWWREYDENGNVIHLKNSFYESWSKYNEDNKCICFINSAGEEFNKRI